jgi:hypothetical protein
MYRPWVPGERLAVLDTLTQAPEAALLLACARILPTEEDRQRITQAVPRVADWPRLLRLAELHGMLALLFRGLQGAGLPPLPPDVEMRLWTYHEQLQRKNQLMANELQLLVALLEEEGIPVLPFKGPVLAEMVYGSLALREFGDLDLLVAPAHLARARSLMAARGYRPLFPVSPALDQAVLSSPRHYHLALKRELMVELHWKTDPEFPVADLSDPAWWAALPTRRFGSIEVRTLSDGQMAMALLVHGAKHQWEQLNWVAELDAVLRRLAPAEWARLLEQAGALRARRRVSVGLLLAKRWFQTPLPLSADEWLGANLAARPVADSISRRWFAPEAAGELDAFARLRMNIHVYDSVRQRATHVFDVVLRPGIAEWTAFPLPRGLHWLYVPMRAWRLAAKHLFAIRRD